MNTLIPNRLLMNFEFPLAYRKKSAAGLSGTLRSWTDKELLPTLGEIDGETPFAPVWASWNEDGLYVATKVTGRSSPLKCDTKKFWTGDNLRLMIDLRDTRRIKRATRFCYHLFFLPTGGSDGAAVAGSHPVKRAKEDAPAIPSEAITSASRVRQDGYDLEAHIPATALRGFDPAQHPRIGFYYMLEDRDLGQQSLTIGDDLPWNMDPSLWATAVLKKR